MNKDTTYNILIIDDDPSILESFEVVIEDIENVNVFTAIDFNKAKKIVQNHVINLVISDVVLPEIDGYEVLKFLKEHPNAKNAYMLLMSNERVSFADRSKAYKIGAQDFFIKENINFKEMELMLKSKIDYLKSKIKVNEDEEDEVSPDEFKVGKFSINTKLNKFFINDEHIKLGITEFKVMEHLLKNNESIVTVEEIAESLWEESSESSKDNIRQIIHTLRTKIETDPKNPRYLIKGRPIGYKFTLKKTLN